MGIKLTDEQLRQYASFMAERLRDANRWAQRRDRDMVDRALSALIGMEKALEILNIPVEMIQGRTDSNYFTGFRIGETVFSLGEELFVGTTWFVLVPEEDGDAGDVPARNPSPDEATPVSGEEALMFHIDQKETNADVHVRFSWKEARELLDALSVLCKKSEVSENLRYVRKVLELVFETLEEVTPEEETESVSNVKEDGDAGEVPTCNPPPDEVTLISVLEARV